MNDIERRLTLRAAEDPRHPDADLFIQAATAISSAREVLLASMKATGEYARSSGYYEGTLMMIRSGILPAEQMIEAAEDSLKRFSSEA